MSIKNRFDAIINRINNNNVKLLAVSKKQSIEKIESLYQLGQRMFGESYIQEAIHKIEVLKGLDIEWHFIGPIQSNKTKHIAKHFDWVQSVDSIKLMTRLNNQRHENPKKLNVLLQLKVGNEDSKRGLKADEIIDICNNSGTFENLSIRGLMTIPAPTPVYSKQVEQFQECLAVFKQMQILIHVDTLSMGMSGDLETAIESGSTMVRVGTDIFGKRKI